MANKTQQEVKAQKRADALRENLKRRKELSKKKQEERDAKSERSE